MPKKVRRKRIASRGSVNNIILEALNEGDKYGYEIIKQVEEKTNGEIKLKQPSLYSSLGRLEQKGLISSYWGGSDIGGRRHYYYITKAGRHYYNTVILKLEVQQSDEELEAIEQAALIRRQQIMNECNTTKVEEYDDTVYGPKKDTLVNNIPVEPEDNEIDDNVITDEVLEEDDIQNIDESSTTNQLPDNTVDSDYHDIVDNSIDNIPEDTETDTTDNEYTYYLTSIKNSNHKFASNTKIMRIYNPNIPIKKKQVMIKDVDGIYKLRDEEYNPREHIHTTPSRPKIIDNVIIRRNINVVDVEPVAKKQEPPTTINIENMSQLEKEEKNKKFASKFDEITNKIIQEREKEKELEEESDYISKLDMVSNQYDDYEDTEDEYEDNETYIPRNVTLEEGEDPFSEGYMEDDEDDQLSDDVFIDFENDDSTLEEDEEDVEETKLNIKGYKEFKAASTTQLNTNFIRINKARFLFGFVLMLLMIVEVTATYLIIKSTGHYYDKDVYVYVIAYIAIALVSLFYILPYLLNQDKRAIQTFKFKYSAIFGLLTFLILTILIYAFNSLAGFNIANINYFLSTIFVPLVLSFNFAIYSIIYNLIIKLKSLY